MRVIGVITDIACVSTAIPSVNNRIPWRWGGDDLALPKENVRSLLNVRFAVVGCGGSKDLAPIWSKDERRRGGQAGRGGV